MMKCNPTTSEKVQYMEDTMKRWHINEKLHQIILDQNEILKKNTNK